MMKASSILALTINGAASLSISTASLRDRANKRLEHAKVNAIPREDVERSLSINTITSGWVKQETYFDANCAKVGVVFNNALDICTVDADSTAGRKLDSCSVDSTTGVVSVDYLFYAGPGCTGTIDTYTYDFGDSTCTDNGDGTYSKYFCVSSPSYLDFGSK